MTIEEECHEILNKAGVATGDEHLIYTLQERIEWLVATKEYAWRKYDDTLKAARIVTTEKTLEHMTSKLNG